ncbi:unnamed protein product [Adineta ricciae]|uniref:Uncharacterized protein n=1 Tax=Adineta ricciae TaxID=249248 RepID=A0A815Q3A5_ADIRI|nr:unnamed protein product [Adineta ricciae]CAF1456984.1 unnamed protein product [Adineta ricciae]
MQKPTGMATTTAIHYYNVSAQMHNWVNQYNTQDPYPIHAGVRSFQILSAIGNENRLVYNGWKILFPARMVFHGY